MNLRTLKLFTLAFFTVAVATTFINNSHAQQGGAQAEKTAAQAFKNIQVLKDMPASQLHETMDFINVSLGVNCAYCHVRNGDKFEFEKDDKPAKTTARKMMLMQFDINKNNRAIFGSTGAVSCYTCHRGQADPALIPKLPLSMPTGGGGAPPAGARAAEALPTADQVLNKYMQAIGSKAAYEKLKTRSVKGTQAGAGGEAAQFELYQVAPNKIVSIITTPKNGVMMSGYNGMTAWMKNQRGQRELSGALLAQAKHEADFFNALHLKESHPNLDVIGKEKIGEHDTYVLAAMSEDKSLEKFYFDTQTGLLVRTLTTTPSALAPLPEQMDYDDYRDVDGVKLPFTVQYSAIDPRDGWTRKFTEIKHNAPVDESKFNMPPAPPATQK
jgi:hypothetical protein